MRPRRRSPNDFRRFRRSASLARSSSFFPTDEVLGGAEVVAALAGREAGTRAACSLSIGACPEQVRCPTAYRLMASHRPAAMAVTRFALGEPRPEADVLHRLRALSSPPRPLLSRRLRLAVGPGRRARRRERCPADRAAPGLGPRAARRRRYWLPPTLSWSRRATPPSICSARPEPAQRSCSSPGSRRLERGRGVALYLSLSVAGQTFLEFQWDFLLTETGLLAIFRAALPAAAPFRPLHAPARAIPPRLAALSAHVLFRRRSSSPAPTPHGAISPRSISISRRSRSRSGPRGLCTSSRVGSDGSSAVMFLIEFAAPFLFFAPRRLRHCGRFGAPSASPDRAHGQLRLLQPAHGRTLHFPARRCRMAGMAAPRSPPLIPARSVWPLWLFVPVGGGLSRRVECRLSAAFGRVARPEPFAARSLPRGRAAQEFQRLRPLRRDDDERPEIVVEGSMDGATGSLTSSVGNPVIRAPAALRRAAPAAARLADVVRRARRLRANPWFVNLARLLEGSPEVLEPSRGNPFPDQPPRYVRAVLYDYRSRAGTREPRLVEARAHQTSTPHKS